MEPKYIIISILLLIIFLLGRSFKIFQKLFINMVLGVGLLFLINIIGTSYDIHLAINGYTAATASVLGIPGIAALIVIQKWII